MGVPVLVLGASGSGKSTSMRNLGNDVGVFNVASKALPFRKKLKVVNTNDYNKICRVLTENSLKKYVIDDSQYLMAFEQLARAKETGFQKYTDMGLHFANLVNTAINQTTHDTIVYFLHHVEKDENGFTKAKTVGKLIDNWITLEGLFPIVLLCWTDGKQHKFITQSDGFTTAKSPMDMFPTEIDNDLAFVDKTIREYYEFESEGDK
jgi:hypothetical protein